MKLTNLFVYGALMYDEVWSQVVTGKFKRVSAVLTGYKRLAVINEEYPGIIKGSGTVEGYIWLDVDTDNLARLDNFEGEEYMRISAVAIDESGNNITVQVYGFREEYKDRLQDQEWDCKKFENSGLKKFVSRYLGFERLK